MEQKKEDKNLVSFDDAGEPILCEDKVYRGIYRGYGALYRKILHTCEKDNLFDYGIIKTRELSNNPYPSKDYDVVFEHERIPFISYPHEWPATLLRDAALLHVQLYMILDNVGLTLKDWHPYNILFKGTKPIFVDFLSIIPEENLTEQAYLQPPHTPILFRHLWDPTSVYIYEMYKRMYVPYFYLPLWIMGQKKYAMARKRLYETTLNATSSVINTNEIFPIFSIEWLWYNLRTFYKECILISKNKNRIYSVMMQDILQLDIGNYNSSYSEYYVQKNEWYDFRDPENWKNKQRIVYNLLRDYRPRTVLDVACNTGWFSILAAKTGCDVVAIDIDEACVEKLYNYAKHENLSIVPLIIDILNPMPPLYPICDGYTVFSNDAPEQNSILLPVEKRLNCDMVLALAIIHHLALGQGHNFEEIIKKLNEFTKKYLIIEFVSIDDSLILQDPDFFPSLKSKPNSFKWYTLDGLILEIKKYFGHISIYPSSVESRKILFCKR